MTFTGSPRLASSRVRGRSGGRGRRRLGRAHRVRDRQPDRGRRRRCRDLAVQRRSGLVTGGGAPTRSPPRSATSNGSRHRASSPATAASASRVYQSGDRDLRGPLSKQCPRYLRWALVEAATHACTAPVYRDRYQQTKARIGKQRGAKVAQIDLARRLAEAIWHMLSRGEAFAPKGATDPLAA